MAENVTESRQSAAAVLLAAGKTQESVAAEVGVSRRTVARWWSQPDFRRAVRNHRSRMIEAAVAQLANGAEEAASNLLRLANEPHSYPSVRLNATKAVLSFAIEMHSNVEFEERLLALEERMGIA